MKRKFSLLILTLPLLFSISMAQAPAIEWAHSFGGSDYDQASSVVQTSDNGFIVAGKTSSNDGDVTGHHGPGTNDDYWVVKINSAGTIEWQKCYGGFQDDYATAVRQTTDGGYIIGGRSNSDSGDLTGLIIHGNFDYWIVKTDNVGNIQWSNTYGGSKDDELEDLQQTNDGGYILCGTSHSKDGDVTGHHSGASQADIWVVKTDASGNLQWQKSLGGKLSELGSAIIQIADGSYVISGSASSSDHDVSVNHGMSDFWLVKLNENGSINWEHTYGGSKNDTGGELKQSSDGGYVISGNTQSSDGDVSTFNGLTDYWVVKTDASGNLQAEENFGGSFHESSTSVNQQTNGDYIIGGLTNSSDGDVTGFHGGGQYDYWFIGTDATGNMKWNYCYGGTSDDQCTSAALTNDGGIIAAGLSNSNNGDVSGNHGQYDFWIVKLANQSALAITVFISAATFCPGQALTVDYLSSGAYNAGNIFTAQLSDASGNFFSPVAIGSLATTVSGTINATIPPLTPSGTGYRIRVVSSNPIVTGTDNGVNLSIACPVPYALVSGSESATSEKLKWKKFACATAYQVRYRKTGTTNWTTVNASSNTKLIMGLLPSTEYEWSVSTQCVAVPLVTSDFSVVKNFTTASLKADENTLQPNDAINIYPNPFHQTAYIDLSSLKFNNEPLQIVVTDLSGKILFNKTFSYQEEIEIGNDLPAGFYLIEVKGNNFHQLLPVIKE